MEHKTNSDKEGMYDGLGCAAVILAIAILCYVLFKVIPNS